MANYIRHFKNGKLYFRDYSNFLHHLQILSELNNLFMGDFDAITTKITMETLFLLLFPFDLVIILLILLLLLEISSYKLKIIFKCIFTLSSNHFHNSVCNIHKFHSSYDKMVSFYQCIQFKLLLDTKISIDFVSIIILFSLV